jgi:predicted  nucleic acid-binding Zn-ribbon protein
MSRAKIKPKETVKSTMRDAEKYLGELQGINERLKQANNQLAQAHVAMHGWVKTLEERVVKLELHTGLLLSKPEVLVEPTASEALEGPGVEVSAPAESPDVIFHTPGVFHPQAVDSQ